MSCTTLIGEHNGDVLILFMIGTRGEELAAAHGVNTSQSPNTEMKTNQVYGVSNGHGEIVMEKNMVYGLTRHPE